MPYSKKSIDCINMPHNIKRTKPAAKIQSLIHPMFFISSDVKNQVYKEISDVTSDMIWPIIWNPIHREVGLFVKQLVTK